MRKLINAKFGDYKVVRQFGVFETINYLVVEDYEKLEYKVLTVFQEESKQVRVIKEEAFKSFLKAMRYALELTKNDIEYRISLYK